MNRSLFLYSTFFGLLGLTLAVYWCNMGGAQAELLRNVAYLAAPAFAVMGSLYTLNVHGWRGVASRPFVFLALGVLLWGIGEVLWVYYDFVIEETPYPSVADVFYLLAYPALFVGLILQVKGSGVDWRKFDPVIVFLFGIIAVLMAGAAIYFGIILAFDPATSLLENLVAIGYSLADVVIILCSLLVLILAWEFKGGNLMRLYLYFFFAFVMTLVADVGFAIYNDEYVAGSWWIKNVLDTLWIIQYLYFGLAFFTFGLSLKASQDKLLQLAKKRT